ncbi:unnamed protein product [Caenorhabditis sp. 36 PRJEB53466]|nr:unnamed protein product [Caenorhabditis sp. 36 PRJEB53466]
MRSTSLIVFVSILPLLPKVSAQLATCFNRGTPINSTDCVCPGFVAGRLCETVKCQRFSIPDKNRCACPPGWYDKYCGIRGCRPPNEDSLDLLKRSFIIVFNMKTSMAEHLKVLKENFQEMVTRITTVHRNIITRNQQMTVKTTIAKSADDIVDFLDKIELQDGDATQPVLTALKDAQQTFPSMKSHSIVLVLTDSLLLTHPVSQTDSQTKTSNKLPSDLAFVEIQGFIPLVVPDGTDTSPDNVDVYRRLSVANHGDTFFLKSTSELKTFYTKSSQFDEAVEISAPIGTTYNYRVFIQSKNTILKNFNDDTSIDVGNGIIAIGIEMFATMETFGFPEWLNSSYDVRLADGQLLREKFFSFPRPQIDCTYTFAFPAWNTLQCPPGPTTQLHTLYYNGYVKQRVVPAYCYNGDRNAEHPDGIGMETSEFDPISQQERVLSCDEKNIDAVNDPRLEEHKQFVFILEQHSANRAVYQTLAEDIEKIVTAINSTTTGTYKSEFTLVVHNDIESRALISSYSPTVFSSKFQNLVASLPLYDNLDNTLGLLSVVQAQKLNIQPTAQVYYFTNQAVKNVQNVSRTWDILRRDIEVNFFTIADGVTTEIFALPSQLELIQKMTNGRLIPLQRNETAVSVILWITKEIVAQFANLFSDIMRMTSLTTDNEQYDCQTSPLVIDGFVEKGAQKVVVQVVGTGIKTITVADANGRSTLIPLTDYITYQNPNFVSLNIDLNKFAKGVWRLSALVAKGGCQITVRQNTEIGAILGFTSSNTDDNVSTQIISQRAPSDSEPIYIPIRVNAPVVPTNLEIHIVNRKRYDQPESYYNSSISARDPSSCSYNFISDHIVVPKNELTTWTLSAYDSGNLILHRIFYYYQHFPKDISVCNGGQVDQFGRCICRERYTGDYCWDRICQPAATVLMAQLMPIAVLVAFTLFSVTAQQCLNGGTPVNATDCHCPGYVGGRQCETVKCQRWGIPDKNRCACAPGWYDKYCGIRGCRPPNEDNLDLEKRSFIIVFNMKKSMKEQLDSLTTGFKNMADSITKNWNNNKVQENWIENFIVYGFVQGSQKTTITQMISESADDVVVFLKNMTLYDGDDTQPVLAALKNAQQIFPSMKSHAVVLVFTDSPASDATPWSHRFEDKNTEQLCLQISYLWRSKVSFILSIPSAISVTLDGVDVYRRLSLSTHGDYFFVKNSTETTDILRSVISTFYFPENVGVGFGLFEDSLVVPTADNGADWVFTLITMDSSDYEFPEIPGTTLLAKGSNYMLVAAQYMSTVYIKSSGDFYNFRIFLQSRNTLLFDYNSDMMIDVGNGIVHLGVTMHSTIRTFGFPQYTNMTYRKTPRRLYFRDGVPSLGEYRRLPARAGDTSSSASLRNNDYKVRVTPGYCDQIAHYTHQEQGFVAPHGILPVTNIHAINDPRFEEANQFIFILEAHLANKNVYTTLANEIDLIVALANSTSTGSYKKEFTLIVNNDDTSRVLLSTYNPAAFVRKFRTLVNGLVYSGQLNAPLGLSSVVQAMKSNIKPTAQVYYFTNQAVKNVQNSTRKWDIVDRNIEFNFFTIADGVTTEVFALPWQLELVQKMSNGRIIPLGAQESTLVNLFADVMPMNALTTDMEKYDCHTVPFTLDAFVEKETQRTVFQFVGTGLNGISIVDAAGKTVPAAENTHFGNVNFKSLSIDTSKFTPGVWKVSVSAAGGGCQITVRHRSTNGVIYGFTEKSVSDTVNSQIPLQRTTEKSREFIYVPVRIKQSANAAKAVSSNLEIQIINRMRYDEPVSYKNLTIMARDANTCSFNWITPKVQIPSDHLTTWTLTSYDSSNNLILRRIFYYYQHSPADSSICHGGEVDKYGQCVCPERYTGEYCWDRICASGATLSYGICSCSSGFFGDFCELELMMTNASSTYTPLTNTVSQLPSSSTTVPLPTTTRISTRPSGLSATEPSLHFPTLPTITVSKQMAASRASILFVAVLAFSSTFVFADEETAKNETGLALSRAKRQCCSSSSNSCCGNNNNVQCIPVCLQQCQSSCQSVQCVQQCQPACNQQCGGSQVILLPQTNSCNQCQQQCISSCATPICAQSCGNTCASSCGNSAPQIVVLQPQNQCGACQSSCQSTCPTCNCQSACAPACGGNNNQIIVVQQDNSCSSSCNNQCSSSCSTPICIQSCQSSCQQACQPTCVPQCMPSCSSSCTSNQAPIVIVAQQGDSCSNSCSNQCQSACPTPICVQQCNSQCQSQCSCSGNSCNQQQVIVLQQQDNCQNQCQSSCMNTCQASATVLQCQPICQQTCQSTCQQAAQIVVPCTSTSSGCGCSSGYSQCGGSCCRRR